MNCDDGFPGKQQRCCCRNHRRLKEKVTDLVPHGYHLAEVSRKADCFVFILLAYLCKRHDDLNFYNIDSVATTDYFILSVTTIDLVQQYSLCYSLITWWWIGFLNKYHFTPQPVTNKFQIPNTLPVMCWL